MTYADPVPNTETRRRRKAPEPDPSEIMMAIIRKNRKGRSEEHIAAFNLATDGSLELFPRFRARWVSLEYSRLRRLANPPTDAERKRRKAQIAKERALDDAKAEEALLYNIWTCAMPGGKRGYESTLTELADRHTSIAAAINAVGKGKMEKRADRVFKSAAAFVAAMKRTGHV